MGRDQGPARLGGEGRARPGQTVDARELPQKAEIGGAHGDGLGDLDHRRGRAIGRVRGAARSASMTP